MQKTDCGPMGCISSAFSQLLFSPLNLAGKNFISIALNSLYRDNRVASHLVASAGEQQWSESNKFTYKLCDVFSSTPIFSTLVKGLVSLILICFPIFSLFPFHPLCRFHPCETASSSI